MKLATFIGVFILCATLAGADSFQRIGHTTLTPRNTNPDDRGMYAAAIDPTSGFAYFVGQYLFKLDITGNLPVPVCPPLNIGQSVELMLDATAGYLYQPRGGAIYRYGVGAGTNAPSSAGSLTLAAGSVASVAVDDVNHYAYAFCNGNPAKVAKVVLSTFTEAGSVTLNAGETNVVFCTVTDVTHGYAYFLARGAGIAQVVKVKFTPGASAPIRIGAVSLANTNQLIDGAAIDTSHGYAYYGTYNSDTNVPGRVYKVQLGEGDVSPTLVGYVDLQPGEGRLAASVCDPVGGFVYFADDNTYPGHVYQLSLNGTNLPMETSVLTLQPGWSNSPPNGVTAGNTTTNADGLLPFGEVFFRSAVYDPVRGCAYFGQDSRPNQVVKVQLRSPFELWQSAHFGTNATNLAVAGDLASPAGDGIPNLLKYALGLDPAVPSVTGLPTVSLTDGYLTLAYNRNAQATDILYIPEVSSDLATWKSGPPFVNETIVASNALFEIIHAQDLVPLTAAPSRFIRLRISHP